MDTGSRSSCFRGIFAVSVIVFVEVPESLWSYEIEHQLWHFIGTQIGLGL